MSQNGYAAPDDFYFRFAYNIGGMIREKFMWGEGFWVNFLRSQVGAVSGDTLRKFCSVTDAALIQGLFVGSPTT